MKRSNSWTDEQIVFLQEKRDMGFTFEEIADQINEKFKKELLSKRSGESTKKAYYRYEDFDYSQDAYVRNLQSTHRAKKSRSETAKANRNLLDYLSKRSELLEEIQELICSVVFSKPKVLTPRFSKKKRDMVVEVMLTDLHYGKKTKDFNLDKASNKAQQMAKAALGDVTKFSKNFNIKEIVTYLGGDIIENADFHGKESTKASECGTSEQVKSAIFSLYEDYIVPIVSSGYNCHFVCVTGNHDRLDEKKSFQDPGKENLTWIIYNTLELLCRQAGFKNVTFDICEHVFTTHKIFDDIVLYEHGDFIKGGMTRNACEAHMAKRSKQVGSLIDFMRLGHFHEPTMYGRGKIIINGSFPGDDSYSIINGYSCESVQTINFYIKTENRPNSFYHSFPVYLD